MINQTAKNLYK